MASRVKKLFKQYERHVLIGVVIILLATFSISGIFTRGAPMGKPKDDGGDFEVTPGKRVTVTSDEFEEVRARYEPILLFPPWGPSVRWAPEMVAQKPVASAQRTNFSVWQHIALVRAATEAGYLVGDAELREGIETLVRRAMGGGRDVFREFTPEQYDQVLAGVYPRRSKIDFEKTVREILLKDKFLLPIVESMRFSRSRADAYEAWKGERERMDLAFVGVAGAPFVEAVEKEEATRSSIAKVADGLRKLADARGRLRLIVIAADGFRQRKGKVAADAKELATDPDVAVQLSASGGALPNDPWAKPFVYRAKGEGYEAFSAGPDGKEDTADDVGADVANHLDTLSSLRLVADALVDWRKKAKSWPKALADLTTSPPVASGDVKPPPLLASVPKDAWGKDLAYDAAGPVLLSTGPDGARGGDDDVEAKVTEAGATVPLPKRLQPFADAAAADAWGRPLSIGLKKPSPPTFEATSAGADGVPGGDDDLATGNEADLNVYYSDVRGDYREPMKREFEALYVLLPLVPDAALAKAWKAHPEWRHDETALFDRWRAYTGIYFTTRTGEGVNATEVDPADEKLGHGAELVKKLEEAGKVPAGTKGWLVPAPETFGEQKDPPTDLATRSASDPLWKEYVSRGWRRVLMREMFFENLLAEALRKARESAVKHAEWEKGKAGPEPEVETFTKRLATLAEYAPSAEDAAKGGRFVERWQTEKPLSREDAEKVVEIADSHVTDDLKRLKDGEYAPIPTVAKGAASHLALRTIKVHAERVPPLDEVRTAMWPKYVEHRALERAAKELEKVRDAAAKGGTVAEAAKSVLEPKKVAWFEGATGEFLAAPGGFRLPLPVPEGATDAQKAEIARRSYVRQNGPDAVSTHGSKQDPQATGAGAVATRVLRDRPHGSEAGTNAAYLVQVKSRRDPPAQELTAKRYADWLANEIYGGDPPWEVHRERLQQRQGVIPQELARWFDNWDGFKRMFDIHTNRPIELER